MNICPECGNTAVSLWGKLRLRPAIPSNCQVCGAEIGVPPWSAALGIPFVLVILIGPFVMTIDLFVITALFAAALLIIGYCVFVPLIKPQYPKDD